VPGGRLGGRVGATSLSGRRHRAGLRLSTRSGSRLRSPWRRCGPPA
jgi:hypothetical protein